MPVDDITLWIFPLWPMSDASEVFPFYGRCNTKLVVGNWAIVLVKNTANTKVNNINASLRYFAIYDFIIQGNIICFIAKFVL